LNYNNKLYKGSEVTIVEINKKTEINLCNGFIDMKNTVFISYSLF